MSEAVSVFRFSLVSLTMMDVQAERIVIKLIEFCNAHAEPAIDNFAKV